MGLRRKVLKNQMCRRTSKVGQVMTKNLLAYDVKVTMRDFQIVKLIAFESLKWNFSLF